jgi:hypothetical protein
VIVSDQQARTELAENRMAHLKLDWPTASPPSRARLALSRWLIHAGDRLAPEPCRPRPELSSRA